MKFKLLFSLSFFCLINVNGQVPDTIKVRSYTYKIPKQPVAWTSTMPEFILGNSFLYTYINTQLVVPDSLANPVGGICYVQFLVLKDGSVDKVKLMRGVSKCPDCDKEAIRVVSSLPKFIPATQYGKAVDMVFSLPIDFKRKKR